MRHLTLRILNGICIKHIFDYKLQRNYHFVGREQERNKFIITLLVVVATHGREMNLLAYEKKDGSYVTDMSRELMEKARDEVLKRVKVLADNSEPMNLEKQTDIARDVMTELMGPNKPGRAHFHGAGVTKSQVTKFGCDLRKLRGDVVTKENRFLLEKVNSQNKQIEMQSKMIEVQNVQMRIMERKVDECTGELRLFRSAFQGVCNGSTSGDMFFTSPHATEVIS
ncbi:uncharacterized protein [Rutidosis leptorrhynchoides]|uniref:uncharacterized protein isoform X2 n=1 Tax=Rutidosis leptorrhynchoides TaxID=125765 RepID=UPI003A991586